MPRNTVTDPKTEGLYDSNLNRNQVLNRLWQLANLDPEQTKGSIAGQIKAISMIVAIEGLIPDRRLTAQPVPMEQPVSQRQPETVAAAKPAESPVPESAPCPGPKPNPPSFNSSRKHPVSGDPFVYPQAMHRAPNAVGNVYDVHINPAGALRLPLLPRATPAACSL